MYTYTIVMKDGTTRKVSASMTEDYRGDLFFANKDLHRVAGFAAGSWASFTRSEVQDNGNVPQ